MIDFFNGEALTRELIFGMNAAEFLTILGMLCVNFR